MPGDASLWWRIADANSLAISADAPLTAGQTLTVPRLALNANNADTFQPYDPSKITGSMDPTLPMPAQGDKCGGMGQIIMAVVAVVVAIYAPVLLSQLGVTGLTAGGTVTALGGAVGGAAGSIASQVVGNAIGAQDGFSWKGVAMGALAGGISAGLSGSELLGGNTWQMTAARMATANALTQGVAVATGLQKSFDWRGVAASAVGGGVGVAVSGPLTGALGDFGGRLATGLVAGTAAAVARGGKVAIQQVAVDAFGNALGSSLADAMSTPNVPPPVSSQEKAGILALFADGPGEGYATSMGGAQGLQPGRGGGTGLQPTLGAIRAMDDGINAAAQSRWADESRVVKDWNPDDLSERPGYTGGLLADASGAVDKMGQPLNGRSNYNAFRKFGEIFGGIPQRPLSTTLGELADWATYTAPDAQQRAAEITSRYAPDPRFSVLDRALASPLGGAAYGLANLSGASPATQELLLGLGSAADGLLMSAAAIKGAAPSFLGAQRPGVMDVESPYALTSNNYLSGIARSDKLGMGIRLEANQGLLDSYSLYGGKTATQLYVRAFDGNGNLLPGSVRLDRVGLRADGGFDLIDYKLSTRSPLTENQGLHYPALAQKAG